MFVDAVRDYLRYALAREPDDEQTAIAHNAALSRARDHLLVVSDQYEGAGGSENLLQAVRDALHVKAPDLHYWFTPEAVDWVFESTARFTGLTEEAMRLLLDVDDLRKAKFRTELDRIAGTHGWETLYEEDPSDVVGDLDLEYLNTGYPYTPTLVLEDRELRASSWGGEVEAWEEKVAEEGWTRDEYGPGWVFEDTDENEFDDDVFDNDGFEDDRLE